MHALLPLVTAGLLIAADAKDDIKAQEQKQIKDRDDDKVKDNKALRDAAAKGDVATVMALIKKGADVNWRDPQPYAKTPLNAAILGGRLDVAKVLLENGADINYPDISGRFPVYFCHPHRDKEKAVELLKFVLSKGGDKDVNREPGMLVSLCDHEMGPPELIPILVAAGANPNMHFKSKEATPLIAAIKAKNPELRAAYVKALIENKADVNFKDKKGMSPLEWAKKVGDKTIVEMLQNAGAKE
jgi:ankyrin repeat protein